LLNTKIITTLTLALTLCLLLFYGLELFYVSEMYAGHIYSFIRFHIPGTSEYIIININQCSFTAATDDARRSYGTRDVNALKAANPGWLENFLFLYHTAL